MNYAILHGCPIFKEKNIGSIPDVFFFFIPLFVGSKTPAGAKKLGGSPAALPVNARLVRANNRRGMNPPPLIIVSLYISCASSKCICGGAERNIFVTYRRYPIPIAAQQSPKISEWILRLNHSTATVAAPKIGITK